MSWDDSDDDYFSGLFDGWIIFGGGGPGGCITAIIILGTIALILYLT